MKDGKTSNEVLKGALINALNILINLLFMSDDEKDTGNLRKDIWKVI